MPVVLHHGNVESGASIQQLISESRFEEFVVVVPTKRKIRHLTRDIVRNCSVGAVPSIQLFTLETLARRLLEIIAPTVGALSHPLQLLLFHNAIIPLSDGLFYFGLQRKHRALSRGTFKDIVDLIINLKESGIYPEMLEQEISLADIEEKEKLSDVVAIYKAYEAALDSINVLDPAGVFKLLHIACPQSDFVRAFRVAFPLVKNVSIAGFDEFAEPEIGLIRKICSVPGISISLVFDFRPGNTALFGHLEENYRRFREMGFISGDHFKYRIGGSARDINTSAKVMDVHDDIARRLFSSHSTEDTVDLSGFVTIVQTRDKVREVELICKIIKQLVIQNPARDLSRICVAMYRPQGYTDLFRDAFRKFGIPGNITDRYDLSRSPLVAAILALLQIAVRGFRREDVVRATATSYFRCDVAGAPLDSGNLTAVSRELRITAGFEAWIRKIDHKTMALTRSLQAATDEYEVRRLRADLHALNKAHQDIEWLDGLLKEIGQSGTPEQFLRRLRQLLNRLQVSTRVLSTTPLAITDLVERDSRALAKLLDALDEMTKLLEFQHGQHTKHSLAFYLEQLTVALSHDRYNVLERFGNGVLVTSIEETRGLPIDVMFVAGLVDGEFPSVYQPEVFLTSTRRLQREVRHTWENRYLYYQAITNWSEHLYLSYPVQDDGLEVVRSTFVDALLNIARDVELWSYPGMSLFDKGLFSLEDLQRYHGKVAGAGFAPDLESNAALPQAKSDRIAKAVKIERSRVQTHDLPDYEGRILDSVTLDGKTKLDRLRERIYSVSQLEIYGKCPFQYFVNRVLSLRSVGEFEEELSPLEKGTLLHEALFEFYTRRRKRNLPPLWQCSDQEYREALEELLEVTARRLDAFDVPDPFWDLERQQILGSSGRRGLMEEYLSVERGRKSGVRPQYFEVGFGPGVKGGKDPIISQDEPIHAGGVRLRGKVDRVDVADEVFTIVDYKTSSELPRIGEMRQGISLQMPMYLFAIEQLLRNKGWSTLHPAGGLFYQLRSPVKLVLGLGNAEYTDEAFAEIPRSNQFVATSEELRDIIDETITFVRRYVDEIAGGKFPLTTPDKVETACRYCDYQKICRIQTVRTIETGTTED